MTTAAVLSPPIGGVLIASPNTFWREQVLNSLPQTRGPVHQAWGGADALVKLETGNWQILFLDRRLPDLDAEELLEIIRRRFPGIEVVVLDSDSGSPPLSLVSPARGRGEPSMPAQSRPGTGIREMEPTREEAAHEPESLPGMIGDAASMQQLYRLTRLVAGRQTTVLIVGATGTGKELVARALHQLSPRSARPFVVVNCAAIPETLLESELFGHTRGAFTGAVQSHGGRIQSAQGGTLFLDEIGELPLSLQAKLLRFLEQKEVQRLGSTTVDRVDVRILAATNAELESLVEEGKFRADLFYRLSAFPLAIPSLSERVEDIVTLAKHFLTLEAEATKRRSPQLTGDAAQLLQAHPWKGNVRELQHVMERAAIFAGENEWIGPEHLFLARAVPRRAAPEPAVLRGSV